jgi:hypothetical protein
LLLCSEHREPGSQAISGGQGSITRHFPGSNISSPGCGMVRSIPSASTCAHLCSIKLKWKVPGPRATRSLVRLVLVAYVPNSRHLCVNHGETGLSGLRGNRVDFNSAWKVLLGVACQLGYFERIVSRCYTLFVTRLCIQVPYARVVLVETRPICGRHGYLRRLLALPHIRIRCHWPVMQRAVCF